MLEFIKFELKYRFSRPVTYIYFAILLIISFLAVTTDAVRSGGSGGKIMENAPIAIAQIQLVLTIFALFIVSAIMGVPVLRDFEHKTDSMIFTTPTSKFAYLGGKFIGSFIVTLFVISGILLGMSAGQAVPWPWHDFTDKLNPYSFEVYLNPFLVFIIPNTFIFSAIFFAGGAIGKRMVVVYAQGIVLFMGYLAAQQFLSQLDNQELAAMLDPFGFGALSVETKYWTVAEQNSYLFSFSGLILKNKLTWLGIGILSMILTYVLFNFQTVGTSGRKRKKKAEIAEKTNSDVIKIPKATLNFNFKAYLLQVKNLSWFYLRWITKQVPFIFITLAGFAFIMVVAFASGTGGYDIGYYQTTNQTVNLIGLFNLFLVILVVLYTGELMWKERDIKMNLIYDALPFPDSVSVISKFLGMVMAIIYLLFILTLTGVMIQVVKGFPVFEWDVYFTDLFLDTLSILTLYIILGLFIQSIVNHKFLGFGLMFLFYISLIVLEELGVEHRMFFFGDAGIGTYSEMNNYGHFLKAFAWFDIYWFGFAGALFAMAIFFISRGLETNFMTRIRQGKLRLNKTLILTLVGGLTVFVGSGSFIFYNTNVINEYRNSDEQKELRADYERTLKKYEFIPQPKIVDVFLETDIYPTTRDFNAKGYYWLKNKTSKAIDAIHISESSDYQVTTDVSFNHEYEVAEKFENFGYTIYKLNNALGPGDSVKMNFEVALTTKGFTEGSSNVDVVYNGTFFNNSYFPGLGYNSGYELSSDEDRKEYGFEPKERMMERDDPRGIANPLFGDDADKISFEMIVSTDSSQIAIAPGYLEDKWDKGSRTYYRYKMDAPMVNFYSVVSADYEVKKDVWQPSVDSLPEVKLEIYYNKGHEYNLERMMNGMKKALDYYSENFSPYQFRQLRIMEFPRYRRFAQSFANTVPFSEAIGFIQKIEEDDVDLPFYVTAHEVAHQWWGHQVTEAGVKGNAMLSETLSQYSSLMVLKKHYEPEIVKKFLAYELNSYLSGRTFESKKEMPLEKVEGQGYIHYRKGSVVMYALQDYISEDSVNAALKRFVNDWAFKEAPYPTSQDLLGYYREVTPDSLQYIITDMFETITLFENKATEATYEILPDSTYKVSVTIDAIKYRADSLGTEESIKINDWIDIGVLTENEDGEEEFVYLQKHKIDEQTKSFEIIVDQLPAKAGIDPMNKLIDRNPKDNTKKVELEGEAAT